MTQRGRPTALAIAIVGLIAVGCLWAAVGPLAGVSRAAGCDDSWKAAVSGNWDDGTNWSTGSAPSSTQNACITADGTYTVTLTGGVTVASLTLGGGSNGQTLAIRASNAVGAQLTLTGDSSVSGALKLTDSDPANSGPAQARLVIGTGATLTNTGTILSDPGPAGQGTRVIDGQSTNSGTLDNASGGTITVNQDLEVDNAGGAFTTSGNITIAPGEKLLFAPNGGASGGNPVVYSPTLTIAGGTITDNGTFGYGLSEAGNHAGAGALNVTGGTVTGGGLISGDGGPANFSGTGSGTYTFTGTGSAASTLLSGTIGANQTVTLSANAASGSALVTVGSNVTNNGTIKLTDSDASNGGNVQAHIEIGSGDTLTNNGTISSDPGAGGLGGRVIDAQSVTGHLDNSATGSIDVHQDLQIDSSQSGVFTTAGNITIDSGKRLLVDPNGGLIGGNPNTNTAGLDIEGGTITDNGTFSQGAAGLIVNGGTITGTSAGTGLIAGSGSSVGTTAGSAGASFSGTGSGTYTFVGCGCASRTTLQGTIGPNETVALSPSHANGGVTAEIGSDMTNNGTIELTDSTPAGTSDANAAQVMIDTGVTLTNAGKIVSDPGPGSAGQREVNGQSASATLSNPSGGEVDVNQGLQIDATGSGTFTTTGTVKVSNGETFQLAPNGGSTVNLNGGTVTNSGAMEIGINSAGNTAGGATFNVNGGAVSGGPVIAAGATTRFFDSGSGSFQLEGGGSTLAGTIPTADTVTLSGTAGAAGSVAVTAFGAVVNDGMLKLTDPDATPGTSAFAQLSIPAATSTFTNNGTMVSDPGPAASGYRSIDGIVDNTGTLNVNMLLQLGLHATSALDNSGTVSIASGQGLLNYSGGGTGYTQSAGATTLHGGGATLTAPSVTLQGGTLAGAGSICGPGGPQANPCGPGSSVTHVTNGGIVSPGATPSTITVEGTYTQQATGFLSVQTAAGGADQLSVTGSATLGGTLEVSTPAGFTPTLGQTFKVLQAASVSGQFAAATGLSSGPYRVDYNTADVTLTTVAAPPPGPMLSINDVSVDNSDYGAQTATFTVTLSPAQTSPVTVNYATANGTAIAGSDYESTSGSVTFSPGQTTKSIPVKVLGGAPPGPSRTFFLDLSNASSGVGFTSNRGTATIVHQPPSVSGAVNPSFGGNGGDVTVTIQGSGLFGSPTVELTAPGKPDIAAKAVVVAGDGRSLLATFDLNGASLGLRNVVITNPGAATSTTLANAFHVIGASKPQIAASLAGPTVIRALTRVTYELVYQNLGNVDAYGTVIRVGGLPAGTPVQIDGVDEVPAYSDLGNERVLNVTIPHIAANGGGVVSVSFLPPNGLPHHFAYLTVHVIETSASSAFDQVGGVTLTPTFTKTTATEAAGTLHVSDAAGSGDIAFDVAIVSAPPDGQPQFTETTSGDQVSITALVPPAPAPQLFGSGTSTPLFCGGVTKGTAVAAPAVGCGGAVGAVQRARDRAVAAGVVGTVGGWVKVGVVGALGILSKLGHANGVYDAEQGATFERRLNGCLNRAGYFRDNGASFEQANRNADMSVPGALVPLLADVPNLDPLSGQVLGKAADSANSLMSGAWADALVNYLRNQQQQGAQDPYGILDDPQDSTNQVIMKIVMKCIPCPSTTIPQSIFSSRAADTGPGIEPDAATVADPRAFAADAQGSCPFPPPPPPFPVELRTSGDPNDMIGPPGARAVHWVRRTLGSPYTYTAIFENEPTASAPAYQVRVVDKLDPSRLNLNSLRLGPVRFGSHAVVPPPDVQNWSTQVDMRPAENIRVNVAAGLDRKSATLTWVLTAIDGNTGQPVTSATSGFLPPDSVPPEGDGAVSFTVTPKAGLRTGARIGNGARIFFDTNAPIDTRTWINTIDGTPPSSSRIIRVTPSSTVVHFKQRHRTRARRYPSLTVRWTAHDRGSGPAAYDLFASSGRSRFTRVLGGADATAVHVICKRGRRYRFYVRAYDAAGNAQNGHSSIARPVRCR